MLYPVIDHNIYNLGNIARYNIIIAGLYQSNNSPVVIIVIQIKIMFPNLRFGILIGIRSGIPVKTNNRIIRLSNIVVSKPIGGYFSVI